MYRKPVTSGRNCYVFSEAKAWFLGVPYITTEYCIVDEMLKALALKSQGVLFDLDCGDGRIVIEAAKNGVRVVGIDNDPQRIVESKANEIAAKVNDQPTFLQ